MKRLETATMLRAIRLAWPDFRLGPGELEQWQYDLGLLELQQVREAIAERRRVTCLAPTSVDDLRAGGFAPHVATVASDAGSLPAMTVEGAQLQLRDVVATAGPVSDELARHAASSTTPRPRYPASAPPRATGGRSRPDKRIVTVRPVRCLECESPLPPAPTSSNGEPMGRPRLYCGQRCRDAARPRARAGRRESTPRAGVSTDVDGSMRREGWGGTPTQGVPRPEGFSACLSVRDMKFGVTTVLEDHNRGLRWLV